MDIFATADESRMLLNLDLAFGLGLLTTVQNGLECRVSVLRE
jgi:hypothetical protein